MNIKENIEKATTEDLKKENNQLIIINNQEEKISLSILSLFSILTLIFTIFLLILMCTFTIINKQSKKIIDGIYIKQINVSGLSKEDAYNKINDYINSNMPKEINLKHSDYETSISTEQLNIYFDIDEAINIAYDIGRNENILKNGIKILKSKIAKTNIDPALIINENEIKKQLDDISTKLPDKIIDNSYYIEGSNLIITKGSSGYIVDTSKTIKLIEDYIINFNTQDNSLELITEVHNPDDIDIGKIYNEIHKDPVDASYTENPYSINPSEDGLDFDISLDEAKQMLQEDKSEYIIPLKILTPNITTNMIRAEAFPDLLSDFSTNYSAANINRTTNLILAANKINGTVLMPGEVFSYNKVVGQRTIAAGYKEAPIYVQGRVENGLGGGICQITTTLYNAVLYANLEVLERSNHQFVTSYSPASRDATVVYGAIDFKFRNNREYPIKITCSVQNGIANFKIYGLKTENDYDVQISTRITGNYSNYIYSEAYKTLSKNGVIVSTELLSKDIYKKH